MVVDLKKAISVTHNVIKNGRVSETIRENSTRIIDATIKNTKLSGIVEVSGKAKVFLHKGKYATINNNLEIVYELPIWWPAKEVEYEKKLPVFAGLWALFRTGKRTKTVKKMIGEDSFEFYTNVRFAIPSSDVEIISNLD